MAKNYYEVLAVGRDASPEQIKKSYRKLARKYHPDISKEADAEEQMQSINVAYDTLSNAEKKKEYDFSLDHPHAQANYAGQSGADGFSGAGQRHSYSQGGGDFGGFEDLFGRFGAGFGGGRTQDFSQGRSSQQAYAGEDQHVRIEVEIEVAYHGTTQQFTLQIPSYTPMGEVEMQRKTLEVKIPKGIKQGQQIRLANQGQQGINGGKNGDLYVEINYKESDKVHVDGANVHYSIDVAPWEIALGQSIEIDSPAGKVNVTLPKTAKTGQQLRLVDKGIPSKTPGHLYLKLNIVIPVATTEAEQQAYRQLAESFNHFNPRRS